VTVKRKNARCVYIRAFVQRAGGISIVQFCGYPLELDLDYIHTRSARNMSTTHISDILARAGKVDKKFENASPSTENEKVKTCEDLVSALDKLIPAQSGQTEKIVYCTLYALIPMSDEEMKEWIGG
jgi:hypothetical protein